ncbi:MAG: hypothetical protein R3E84_08315 [Pseudomonadales bacterium]
MIGFTFATGRRAVIRFISLLLLCVAGADSYAVESDGDWRCVQAEDTGRWSCSRDGEPTTTDQGIGSAGVNVSGNDSGAPIDPSVSQPYEELSARAAERIDATEQTSDVGEETPAAVQAEPEVPPVVPPAPKPVAETVTETVNETVTDYVDAPEASEVKETTLPTGSTSVDRESLPDYQRLAYVPDKPTSLLDLPANFWVAQIMAVSSKEFLESYAEEHNLHGLSAARIASGDRLFFVLLLGIYETRENATRAITDMPPPYDKYHPLLRTVGSLQAAMRKADEMTGSSEF